MIKIEDPRHFEEELLAVVQDYLDEIEYYKQPVMMIGHQSGAIAIDINEPHRVKRFADGVEYALTEVYLTDELGEHVPNYEAIDRISRQWDGRG